MAIRPGVRGAAWLWPAGSEPMPAFCRDCLVSRRSNGRRTRQLSALRQQPRIVAASELFALTIAHIDCDAFYASVEKRDRPELAARPSSPTPTRHGAPPPRRRSTRCVQRFGDAAIGRGTGMARARRAPSPGPPPARGGRVEGQRLGRCRRDRDLARLRLVAGAGRTLLRLVGLACWLGALLAP